MASFVISLFVGSFGSIFLYGLKWAYNSRTAHHWILWLLPIGGFTVGYIYNKWGKEVEGGNNLIIEEINTPTKPISFLMAPLILIGTVITHLFGGSAGREGTAVQIGASLSDQISKLFKLKKEDRKIILKAGVAAGFAAVFGTPLAGMIFSFEVAKTGVTNYKSLLISFTAAVLSNHIAHLLLEHIFNMHHVEYTIDSKIEMSFENFLWAILAGIAFGLAGMAFSLGTKYSGKLFKKIKYPPLRPALGGLIFVCIVFLFGYENTERFQGLGIEHIVFSFKEHVPSYDFLAKITFTSLILGAGFKGGEVTPLFFTGATLGNTLSKIIPLPLDLLAGMGFVAVFAAAANTPLTTIIMGIELFGTNGMYFIGLSCIIAYLVSGKTGIYKSQLIGIPKSTNLTKQKNQKIG